MKKRIATILTSVLMFGSLLTTPVYAADGITVKLDDVGNHYGYTVKGYYGGVEAKAKVSEDGTYFFAGQSDAEFSYAIYNAAGECVSPQEVIYTASPKYLADDYVFKVFAPTTYEEITLYNMEISGLNTSDMEQVFEDGDSSFFVPTKPYETEGSMNVATPLETNGVVIRVTNSKLMSALQGSSFKLTLTGTDGSVREYPVSLSKSEFILDDALTSGTYSISYTDFADGITGINSNVTLTATATANYLDITVIPSCTLEVRKANAKSAEYKVKGISDTFNISEGLLGVKPGRTYMITDVETERTFEVSIPSKATRHVLDLSTADGTPINNSALQDAELGATASVDNPFNIPPTYDITEVMMHDRLILMNSVIFGVILSGIILFRLLTFKKRP